MIDSSAFFRLAASTREGVGGIVGGGGSRGVGVADGAVEVAGVACVPPDVCLGGDTAGGSRIGVPCLEGAREEAAGDLDAQVLTVEPLWLCGEISPHLSPHTTSNAAAALPSPQLCEGMVGATDGAPCAAEASKQSSM